MARPSTPAPAKIEVTVFSKFNTPRAMMIPNIRKKNCVDFAAKSATESLFEVRRPKIL